MELEFIDTHSHLYAKEFGDDTSETVIRALEAGVKTIVLPNIDSSSVQGLKGLCEQWPGLFKPMMGLHPCSVTKEGYKEELEAIRKVLFADNFVAVGEIGMDLYWDKSTQEEQDDAFRIQCQWASGLNIPIAIHSRNATREVIDIIKDMNLSNLTGVFHCFGDGLAEANEIIDLGFKLGIGGVLTFKNSGLSDVMKEVDLKHLILETDSPYLAPMPHRGKRNESAYTAIVAEKLADVKQTSIAEVAKITTKNAKQLFSI